MRTTLNLDDDVLEAAKAFAARDRRSVGEVVSDLVRKAVEPRPGQRAERNGFPLYPISEGVRPVTPERIDELLGKARFDTRIHARAAVGGPEAIEVIPAGDAGN